MSFAQSFSREAAFFVRDRAVVAALVLVIGLSSLAVTTGLIEVGQQQATIDRLLAADREDRDLALSKQQDWGSAAYYGFHLTYDAPSSFAFAALGQRDSAAWKHRVRMLALEGQIYERDAGNPVFALIGRFDFAFFAAFILPLILIALLHDLRAGERSAGRHDLLVVTSGSTAGLWRMRATVLSLAVFLAAVLPLIAAGSISSSGIAALFSASSFLLVYVIFWMLVSYYIAARRETAAASLASLFGIWILLAVIVPAGGRMAIDQLVEMPSGSDILMTQREAVNDAWDLPKSATMEDFVALNPEWAEHAEIKRPFEWKWFFAFQQVGDQKAEALSDAYREGRQKREQLAGRVALLSPPALMERSLERLAKTDSAATLAYEESVRDFHAELREYYYPKLFREEPFAQEALTALPQFSAAADSP